MKQGVLRRFLSVILIAALVMLYLPAEGVKAATDLNVGVSGLNASYEGGSWSRSGTTITGSATGTTESGCSGDTNSATTSTLTLTNNSGSAAVLSFAYERQQSGGTITIDSAQVSSGTFSKGLANGESVQIVLTSGAGKTYTVSVSITGLSLEAEKNVTTTFVPAANGSFSYNGTTVSSETQNTQLSSVAYKLSASAGSGYKFLGWYSQSKSSYLSFDNPATMYFDENQRITAVFVPAATAVFATGDSVFTDLNEAISYAQSKGYSVISLLSSGTLSAGNYSIPSGKTLLIPFDAGNTLYTTKPEVVYGSHSTPVHFRTLTMASGAAITVENGGSISVGSKLSATGQNAASWNGTPTGPHGFISMQSGSAITLNSGGNLYVYGYIGGSGSVEALSGSVVYETFQIRCWRGGSATSNMTSGVFPMSQYYVQNIEVPLTIHYGATEMVYSSANASSSAYPISAAFIGSNGLFRLGSGSKLTKQYDGATDRVIVDIDGNSELSTFTISGLPLIGSMSTSNFVLPLNSNFTIRLKSGTTKISQDMAVLPGVQVEIDQGAVLQVASGKSLYIYDQSEWGPYAADSAQLVVVGYSTVNGTTAKRSAADLIDAKIDVNGTLEAAGSIYTTAGGANIMCSEGTGRFVLTSAPGTATTTQQATQSGTTITKVSIPITPAKLHNGAAYAGTDDEYTLTAGSKSGTIFYYNISLDKWSDHEETTYTITFVDSDGTVLKTQTLPAGAMPTPPENPAKETDAQYTYTFAGWTPEITAVTGDATYTAVYTTTLRSYTVKFVHEDGTVLNTQTLAYGAMPEYEGVTPEKASTAQYAYTFKGWTPEITTVVGDATYTATFTEELRSYTVKFVHEDGTVLDTQTLTYGSIPEYQGTTPEKEATVQYTYAFNGWTPEIAVVTGDATYTATFTEALRSYTVKFVHEDGTVLDTQTLTYGTMPEYQGAAPEKASTAQYTYTFKGWAPEIVNVTGDATYTATFTAELRSYTVQFVNADGTVLNTQILAYGSTPEYKGITPEKASTAQYTFTFKGWTPEITTVTSDATYTATYTEELRSYTVKFVNEDGTVLDTQTLEYGTMPEYKGPTPEKASTDQYVYTFAGWAPELTIVTGDAVYTAVFVSTARVFTITWINEDGTVLDTQNVAYGTMPEYKGPTPEKESTVQYIYTFKGWTPEIAVVTGDATYTATFTEALRNYTVKFVNEDGTVLDTQTLTYGTMPEYKGATPEKEATTQYTYTFKGWTPEIAAVTGDTTYTATFTAELRSYTVKFVHEDGTLLDTQTLEYGTMPEYKGAMPEKEATAQYTFTFNGWAPEIAVVTGDATYTATFTEALRSYTVKFVNEDGTVLDTQTLTYGTMPEYKGATPEKASTEQYVYTFAGWAPELTIVTGDAVYTAVFASTARVFTITWINEDGTILDTQNVAYGIMPEYKGPIPEKESTVQYIYTFKGWTPEIAIVTGDASYTATFTEELRSYTVKFVHEDGTVLDTQTLTYGTMPEYKGATPEKASTEQYSYTFKGWTPEIAVVTGEATYTATFTSELRNYTVIFVHEDGAVLDTQTLAYGTMPEYKGATPEKASTEQYSYTFKGWTPEIAVVTGDATYTATFTEALRSYTVKFVNEDGTVLDTQTLAYGTMPEYKGATPEKEATAQYTYTFNGWTPEITTVVGDATYTATFTEELRSYTVKFVHEDGTVLDAQTLTYGTMPEYKGATPEKEATTQYTYTFKGWTPEIAAVTGDTTYTATFTAELRSYTVKFVHEDGTVLDAQTLTYGTMPEYKGATPEKEATTQYTYTFKGWTPEIAAVTGDTTYTATFTAELRSYTVKFVHEDGSVLDTQTLTYGTMPEYQGAAPEKASTAQYTFTFNGWTPEIAAVTGDTTYTATFTAELRSYTVKFVHEDGAVLDTQTLTYGTMPEYKGPTPEKEATAQYTYTFKGWTPEIAVVTGEATYTATFTEALRSYTVKFVHEDGTALDTQILTYGTMPEYKGATPEKESTAQYTFTFNGWTPEIAVVTGDATYTATFTEALRNYTVKFVNEDGTVLDTQTLTYGTMPEYKGATPEKEATTQYTYTFKGWTPEIAAVTGDTTYTATFTAELRSYTVKFVHEDGTVLDTQTLAYGTMPEYKGPTPEKEATAQYTYTFSGWTPEITTVTGDATYTAVFTAEESATPEVLRVAGSNRYKTSLKIADELKEELGITKFDSVILATGEAFADALSGSYLSAVKTAPILLIREKDVSTLKAYITDNLTEGGTIYILGGTGAVPEEWIEGFEGYRMKRLSGSSRYTTNLEVLREAGIPEGSEILIATGENFADSLSASSTGKPILLVKKTLSKVQKEFLSELAGKGMHYTILGGTGAVSDELKAEIEACTGATVERISGKTRYETTVMIAERYFPDARSILLATAENYPDGLCAGVLGTVRKAPLILCTNEKTKDAADFCAEREILSGIVFGGAAVLSDETVRTVLNLPEDVEVVVK